MIRRFVLLAFITAGLAALGTTGGIYAHSSLSAPARSRAYSGLTQARLNRVTVGKPAPGRVLMPRQSAIKLLKAKATKLGPHDVHSRIHLTLGLKLRHVAQLKHFLIAVQNPQSPLYHHFLTPAEFTKKYGPSQAQVRSVTRFLKAHGIKVSDVSSNRILIHTEATTLAYEKALKVRIGNYKLGQRKFFSTENRPQLPKALAGIVTNVIGLDNAVQMRSHAHVKPLTGATAQTQSKGAAPNAAPPPSVQQFNPLQIATAYDWPYITDANNGTGVSIAILTANSANLASASDNWESFWRDYGLPDHEIHIIPVDGSTVNTDGLTETMLDMQYSGAMGPGATLNVYAAATSDFSVFTDEYNQFVTDNTSDVMTTSWGAPEINAPAKTDDEIFMQAAAQGISMFAAAGDNGSSDGAGQSNMADYPSSSLYVMAANGTELTVKDTKGHYDKERAWADGGGAISQVFDEPDWQRGPGVPRNGHRNNSDMAMNAGPLHPYVVHYQGRYVGVYGTSAVAPELAGLFAIAVANHNAGTRLGLAPKLIYDDVNADHYASDFHDVTTGNNGAYDAAPNWDHPTGWGSPKATRLLSHLGVSGPAGTLDGKVSDAASGMAIAGAKISISPGNYSTKADAEGDYAIRLPAGTFTVTVTSFGYQSGSASVTITDKQETSQDFSLTAAPTVKLSGKVTDGSGHDYPLYADVQVSVAGFGKVADAWSDPTSGHYEVSLPKGSDYSVRVIAAFDGYEEATRTLSLTGDKTVNFALKVISACTAPGYTLSGLGEDFNGNFPPAGWTVKSPPDATVQWATAASYNQQNFTGGTGEAATADDDGQSYGNSVDTSLVTPPIPVTALAASAVLHYRANYQSFFYDSLDLDISPDGGQTWQNITHWTASHGAFYTLPGEKESVDLRGYLPASGNIKLRWHYVVDQGQGFIAQIDDVQLGACRPVAGGIVTGQVTDANTGEGLVGASVTDNKGNATRTIANAADPNLPSGTYMYFAPPGSLQLTASRSHYTPASAKVKVANNAITQQDFALKTGQIAVNPGAFKLDVTVGGHAKKSIKITNNGTAKAHFKILPIDAPPPATSLMHAKGARVRKLAFAGPHFMKASVKWARAHAKKMHLRAKSSPNANVPHVAPWQDIADYPTLIGDNTAARDSASGKVYAMGGIANATAIVASAYVYDPASDQWSALPDAAVAREAAVSAFVNGKYYVFNGWDSSSAGNPVAEVDIYDPATGQWTTGTPNPQPAGGGSSIATVRGKVYIVGGCNDGSCGVSRKTVEIYDPASDKWTSAKDYPIAVVFAACAGINGKLYCAGGVGSDVVGKAFVYSPATNSWAPVADMLIPLGGSGYAAGNGKLLVSGGFVTGNQITNLGESYDPATDTWSLLKNSNIVAARGASACGFYRLGGITAITLNGDSYAAQSEVLPGQGTQCGQPPLTPWLSVTPASGTIAVGAAATAELAFDGSDRKAFTTSKAYLSVTNDAPYGAKVVPVTVTWKAQPVGLSLTGSAAPKNIKKGGQLSYTLTVKNEKAAGHGAATQAMLTYPLPAGVSYVASSGDAGCTAPAAGSSSAPPAATGAAGVVTCDLGTLAQGAAKTMTIAVKAEKAGTLASTFTVSTREPNDGDSSLTLKSTVTGTADISLAATGATIKKGKTGAITLQVKNGGPDAATDVKLRTSPGALLKFQKGGTDQGSCTASANGEECDLGTIAAGKAVTVKLTAQGLKAGTATISGQATTSAEDPDETNNVATADVTVKAGGGDGGGGAFGGLALIALLALMLPGAALRRRRRS